MTDPLDGIAGADAILGRPFPLPARTLPLARWVDVSPVGAGAEVAWSLDDSRPGTPGRLALYAGPAPAPARESMDGAREQEVQVGEHAALLRELPLAEAQESLRPVREISWGAGPLELRLTAQGPWLVADLLAIAASLPT